MPGPGRLPASPGRWTAPVGARRTTWRSARRLACRSALGGIDYAKTPGAGTLWQLAVHGALHSCGIGTILIHAAEQRIRARGLHRAELGVEECNPRARALYERLSYVAYGREPASWDEEAPDGTITRYETVCTLMRKELL